jgi:hypothetical protein
MAFLNAFSSSSNMSLQIPLIDPIRPGITGFCKLQDGQTDNNYLLPVAQGSGSPD